MVPFFVELCSRLDDTTPLKRARHNMMSALGDFYNILNSADAFLTDQQNIAFDRAVYECLCNYQLLARDAMDRGQVRWNIIQKHHMMAHLPEIARQSVNPRYVSTYVEESFVGQGQFVCKTFVPLRLVWAFGRFSPTE